MVCQVCCKATENGGDRLCGTCPEPNQRTLEIKAMLLQFEHYWLGLPKEGFGLASMNFSAHLRRSIK